jgi:alkaline phosphatase
LQDQERQRDEGELPRQRPEEAQPVVVFDCRRNETVDTVAIATTDATHATPAAQSAVRCPAG